MHSYVFICHATHRKHDYFFLWIPIAVCTAIINPQNGKLTLRRRYHHHHLLLPQGLTDTPISGEGALNAIS